MNAIPSNDASIDDLSKTELRIQSLSTLLQWVRPQAGSSTLSRPEERLAQFLDNVALIFVSGRHGADAAAVIPTFDPATGFGLAVMATPDESFGPEKTCLPTLVEDKTREDLSAPSESAVEMDSLRKELEADEVAFLVKR